MGLKTWTEWQALPQDSAGLTFPGEDPGTGGEIGTGGGDGVIPAGTILFGPISDEDYPIYVDQDANDLEAPPANPSFNEGFGTTTDGIVQLDDGTYCVTNYAAFKQATFDDQLTLIASDGTDNLQGIASNHVDAFYGVANLGPFQPLKLRKYSAACVPGTQWTIRAAGDGLRYVVGVAADESVAYFGQASGGTTVTRRDLVANTSTTFATDASGLCTLIGIVVMRNGEVLIGWNDYVKHYSAAGAVLHTYDFGDTIQTITPGLTDANFWLTMADPLPPLIRLKQVIVATGATPHDGLLPDDESEWGGPITVVRTAIGDVTPPDEDPPPHVQPPTPLCGPVNNASTVQPNPGCNAGGTGWTPFFTGDSGKVPEVADPDPGEPFTGKDSLFIDVEVVHTNYPSEEAEVLRFAEVDLDDDELKEGRIQSSGGIEQGMSDGQGNLKAATIEFDFGDETERPFGTRMEVGTFARDEVTVRARSDWGRRTGAVPHMLGRGVCDRESYGGQGIARISATDPLFDDTGAYSPDKKVPQWTFPTSYYSNAPPDVSRLFMPVIFGEKSDDGPTVGDSRGTMPWRFLGMDGLGTGPGSSAEQWGRGNACLFAIKQILSVYGSDLGGMGLYGRANATSNGASPSTISLGGAPDLSGVPDDESTQIVFFTPDGVEKALITGVVGGGVTVKSTVDPASVTNVNWYIAPTDYQPRRVKLDLTTRNGDDLMVPKWPGYVRAKPFEDFTGPDGDYRVTDFWIRGPLLDAHLSGKCTIAFNAAGVEENGDSTGRLIREYFTAYNFIVDNLVHRQLQRPFISIGGELFWPQTNGHLPMWSDGVQKTKQSSFAAAQAKTVTALGGIGLEISAYFGYGTSTRDVMQALNDNGACRTTIDEWCRIGVWLLDPYEDYTLWPKIDHVSRVYGDVTRTRALEELVNVAQGSFDWDADADDFREELVEIVSTDGVLRNRGMKRYSKHIDGKLLAKRPHFEWVLNQLLLVHEYGPVYVNIENADAGLMDHSVGSGILLTSQDGPGALGFVDRPMVIINRAFQSDDEKLVTLLCLDVGDLLIPLAQQALMTDDPDTTAIMTDDEETTMVML